jgi:hypothetical protein
VDTGYIWELSTLSTQFCCEPTTNFKIRFTNLKRNLPFFIQHFYVF